VTDLLAAQRITNRAGGETAQLTAATNTGAAAVQWFGW
jgi:hypothetical protein